LLPGVQVVRMVPKVQLLKQYEQRKQELQAMAGVLDYTMPGEGGGEGREMQIKGQTVLALLNLFSGASIQACNKTRARLTP
jgi:hypothetical protein